MTQATLVREFDFGVCGNLVLEGPKQYITAATRMIDETIKAGVRQKKLGHEMLRAFASMFSDPKWKAQWPEIQLRTFKVTCPEGRLCVN